MTDLSPMRPTFFRSPAPEMPLTTTQKTIRPISILISLIKASPSGLSCEEYSGSVSPHTMPSISPRTTWRKIEREHHLSMRGILVGVPAAVRGAHQIRDLIIVVLPVCPVQAQSMPDFPANTRVNPKIGMTGLTSGAGPVAAAAGCDKAEGL
ncbi:hypothetical protein EMIT0324P_50118 [Pseudomonas chlororaphis]